MFFLTVDKIFNDFWPVKMLTGAIASIFFLIFGHVTAALVCLAALVVGDFISGLIKAWCCKTLNSKKLMSGAIKITVYFIMLTTGHAASVCSELLSWIPGLLYAYVAVTETVSIFENLAEISACYGLKISFLSPLLDRLKVQQQVQESTPEAKKCQE